MEGILKNSRAGKALNNPYNSENDSGDILKEISEGIRAEICKRIAEEFCSRIHVKISERSLYEPLEKQLRKSQRHY